MCLNLKTKPYWHHNYRRGLTVGDALCASVSGTWYDWRSDLDVFGIEIGIKIDMKPLDDRRETWHFEDL